MATATLGRRPPQCSRFSRSAQEHEGRLDAPPYLCLIGHVVALERERLLRRNGDGLRPLRFKKLTRDGLNLRCIHEDVSPRVFGCTRRATLSHWMSSTRANTVRRPATVSAAGVPPPPDRERQPHR